MAKKIMMSFVAIFVFWATSAIAAFEPPVDILSLNYEEYAKGRDATLEEGNIVINDSTNYFGTEIKYSVNFDKKNTKSVFAFFKKPAYQDNLFKEYYKDVLMYYASHAIVFEREISYSLDMVEMNDYFLLEEGNINVYTKVSQKDGFYGFGINKGEVAEERLDRRKIDWSDGTWGFWSINQGTLKPISEYDPNKYSSGTYFIDSSTINSSIIKEMQFKPSSDQKNFFEYKWMQLVKKYEDYQLTIETKNLENLEYLLLEYNNGINVTIDLIKDQNKTIKISGFTEILKMRLYGKYKNEAEFGTKIKLTGKKVED